MGMGEKSNRAGWAAGIGLMSAAVLGLEISLSNVFGVLLQYHYVSFVVSLAVFGIGAGSYAAYRMRSKEVSAANAAWVCAAGGGFIAALSFVLAKFPYIGQFGVYAVLCCVPFLMFGWMMGRVLGSRVLRSSTVYAADLLGAGFGAAASYWLLDRLGGFPVIFALSGLCFAAAALLLGLSGGRSSISGRFRFVSVLISMIVVAVVVPVLSMTGSSQGAWQLNYRAIEGAAPDKTIVNTLKADPQARILKTEWDAFARIDTVATSDDSRRIMFVDGGAGSYMYRFNGDLTQMSQLPRDMEFLPFAAGSANKTAIVGSGGGRDILYALLAGAKDVTAVELSQSLVDSMRAMSDYNGAILDRPGVHTIVGDGRTVLERSKDTYDLIALDLVYSQVGGIGGQALAENYVFTEDAFRTYLNRLNAGGRIIVISHQGIEGIRAYYTGLSALLRESGGTPGELASHTALLMAPEGSAAPNLTLSILQKSPLSDQQLQLLQSGVKSLGLLPLFLPKTNEKLLEPLLSGSVPFDKFVRDGDYKVYPTTDDRPFFFQVEKALPPSLTQWGVVIALLTAAFLAFVWWHELAPRDGGGRDRNDRRQVRSQGLMGAGRLSFYTLLGIGYISIQTVLIQKTMIYAGSPTLAAMIVIVAMLVGGSVGSVLAGRFRVSPVMAALAVIAWVLVISALNVWLGDVLLRQGDAMRVLIIGASIFLLGILLGMPLPAGLRREEARLPGSSPFYFAVNGVAGIWGSWLAVTVSVTSGLTLTLAAGCLCYAVVAAMRLSNLGRSPA